MLKWSDLEKNKRKGPQIQNIVLLFWLFYQFPAYYRQLKTGEIATCVEIVEIVERLHVTSNFASIFYHPFVWIRMNGNLKL